MELSLTQLYPVLNDEAGTPMSRQALWVLQSGQGQTPWSQAATSQLHDWSKGSLPPMRQFPHPWGA